MKVRTGGLRATLVIVLAAACSAGAVTSASSPSATRAPITSPVPATASASPTATPAPNYAEVPVAANDADGIARQLIEVDAALRDPNIAPLKLAWIGHLQQLAYSRLQDYPDWQPQVLAALPDKARVAAKGSLDAGKQLRAIPGPIPKTLPDWKILEVAPIDVLLSYYQEGETQFGIPWYYLAAIHLVESRMGRIHGLSTSGAQGPMQFMPATWGQYGRGDINSDHDSILAAARYLKAAGGPSDMQRALYAYNHSQAYVNALVGYATVIRDDPVYYRGYHGWQVYYGTVDGVFYLPVGWVKQ